MRKWIIFFILTLCFSLPSLGHAQTQVELKNVSVQLWPEYDQPSMLVITDFQVSEDTTLPVDMTFRIPLEANLIAVATYGADGSLLQGRSTAPVVDGEWQVFTMTVETGLARFEYYQPLTFAGTRRTFSYLWEGSYKVDAFEIRALEPRDAQNFKTDPAQDSITQQENLKYYQINPAPLAAGGQFTLHVEYDKSTTTLVAEPQGVQPAGAVDESTPGRVSLNNYLPYIIGALGVIFFAGGVFYLWQANRYEHAKPRRRSRLRAEHAEEEATGSYCAQCGTRARPSDRFCRTCGARLRTADE